MWALSDFDVASHGKGTVTAMECGFGNVIFIGTSRGFLMRVPLLECGPGGSGRRLAVEVERATDSGADVNR